jgi:hypothetical protein
MLFHTPAKAFESVTSGELCPPRISAQVVIDPPGSNRERHLRTSQQLAADVINRLVATSDGARIDLGQLAQAISGLR